jgi:hypothetical protein
MAHPTEESVRHKLAEIISYYFTDATERDEMLELSKSAMPPVRHIFTVLHQRGIRFEKEHTDAIHDIFFFYG